MAVKTLGIKFEVAGVKEAVEALTGLRSSVHKTLRINKAAIKGNSLIARSYQKKVALSENRGEQPFAPTEVMKRRGWNLTMFHPPVEAYNKELNKIIEQAGGRAKKAIKDGNVALNRDFAYFKIREKMVEYRKLVFELGFEDARKIGEDLLDESEFLKQVFDDMGDSRKGQLTRIQNEILRGEVNGGRVPVGLASVPYVPVADLLKNNTTKLKDYNRTINDYFFQINQQIKETQLEAQRLISQILYTDIKNRLRSAIAPGSNTFVNGIIDNVQSILDQASQVAEKVFGDRAAQINMTSESRTLETEMKDFIRQIGSAGDAVENFVNRLNGTAKPAPNKSVYRSGTSSFPIAGLTPETAKITSGFGWRNIFGRKDFHEGIDIAARGGTAVRTTNAGIVRHIKPLADQTQVGIETAKGVMEWFIHLGQNLKVGKGDSVNAGQVIGSVAHTSQTARNARISRGDHLDYRVNKNGNWINPMEFIKSSLANKTTVVPSELVTNNQLQTKNDVSSKALQKNKELLVFKQANLTIQKRTTEQERESLEIAVEQTIEANKRQLTESSLENARNMTGLESKFADFGSSYDYQSATTEGASALRDIKQQFLDADLDVSSQIRNAEDAIKSITNQIPVLTTEIARLKAIGTEEALGAAKVSEAALLGLKESLPGLKSNLTLMQSIQSDSAALETKSTKFVEYQNKLKIEQERINKRSLLVNQKATIAEQRGTLEAQRQLKLHQEDLNLTLKINELRQQNAPGEYLDSLIAGEQRQSQVNTDNISYDSEIAELDLEKQLLDLNNGIGDKNAGFLSRYGFNLQADKIKRENAIAAENLRFERELIELRKQYVDRPEELEKLARAATQLNGVNLKSIEQEFKTLGGTVEGLFISSTQSFFNQVATNFFDGKQQRDDALSQEKLRYAEELVQLENQYRDAPGQLAHMKNRARELNEQKLDKINSEFNIFSRVVELAGQAIIEFTKQIAAMLAQQAAAKFISSILGAAVGGAAGGGVSAVANDYGSGASYSAFTADEGATVGDNINSRRLNNRTSSLLKRNFPGVANAFAAEGEGAQIGVFHTGEELLSRKTGEAGRYQGLKARYGINPLEKILNYNQGGTVGFDAEANILSGFKSGNSRIDLSGLDEARRGNNAGMSKTLNITQQIFTPNQDSFMLNADQRNQDLMESLKRGF